MLGRKRTPSASHRHAQFPGWHVAMDNPLGWRALRP